MEKEPCNPDKYSRDINFRQIFVKQLAYSYMVGWSPYPSLGHF